MWEKLRRLASLVLMICFAFWLYACGGQGNKLPRSSAFKISEVSPPAEIQRLNRLLDRYAPQVSILQPQPDAVIPDTKVTVAVAVRDLPIFKSDLGLGPHVDLVIDERKFQEVYDLSQPIVVEDLAPGTHTLRAFASRPWDESFKNEGAFAQVTFHVLTRTSENVPRSDLPALTYHSPAGIYGAEPVLLDFYLRNTSLPISVLDSQEGAEWQLRVTVNGESFVVEDWHPVYLKGLRSGQNWVKVEFLDREGNLVPNVFNSEAYLVTYQPGGKDTLSRLLNGETIAGIEKIVDPNYGVVPEQPAPEVTPETTPAPVATPEATPTEEATVSPPQPSPTATPVAPAQPTKKSRFQFFQKSTPKPEISTPAAAESSPKPEISTPAAAESSPKPEVSAPAAAESSPKPEVSTPAAAESSPKPEVSTPSQPEPTKNPEPPAPKRSRFQLFRKQKPASPVETPPAPVVEPTVTPPPAPESAIPASEEPVTTPTEAPEVAPQETPIAAPAEVSPTPIATEAPAVTEETPPEPAEVEPTPTPAVGRFQLLKSRLEQQKKETAPVPDSLTAPEAASVP